MSAGTGAHVARAVAAAFLGAVLCLSNGAALAHDSWLYTVRAPAAGEVVRMSTGNRFPVGETAPSTWNVLRPGCIDKDGSFALQAGQQLPEALAFTAAPRASAALACWAELDALDAEIPPALVPVYMQEIRPPAAVLEVVRDHAARGVPWRETYRKYARIELAAASAASVDERRAARQPLGWGLEVVVDGDAPVALNQPLSFQVLRDGAPLQGLAIEAVNERSGIGLWQAAGADGRFTLRLPLRGRWVFRGTELQVPAAGSTRWYSRFVTLVVEVP
jgi:hypothetical protein